MLEKLEIILLDSFLILLDQLFGKLFYGYYCYIVAAGVEKGIEKYSKILIPLLLVLIIILDIRSVTLSGGIEGLEFLFKPDFGKLTREGILAALGHAFFSLSLGMGIMITYGSYIPKEEKLGPTSLKLVLPIHL